MKRIKMEDNLKKNQNWGRQQNSKWSKIQNELKYIKWNTFVFMIISTKYDFIYRSCPNISINSFIFSFRGISIWNYAKFKSSRPWKRNIIKVRLQLDSRSWTWLSITDNCNVNLINCLWVIARYDFLGVNYYPNVRLQSIGKFRFSTRITHLPNKS